MAQVSYFNQCATAEGISVTCNPGSQCASYAHTLYGCCPDGQNSCPLATTCVEHVTEAIPSSGPYGVYCTDPAKPYCATFTVQQQGVWRECAGSRLDITVTEAKELLTITFDGTAQLTTSKTSGAPTTTVPTGAVTTTGTHSAKATSSSSLVDSSTISAPTSPITPTAAATNTMSSSHLSTTTGIPASQSTSAAALGVTDLPPSLSTGAIVGIVIGVLSFIIGFTLLIWWYNRRRARLNDDDTSSMPIPGQSMPPRLSRESREFSVEGNMLVAEYARSSYNANPPSPLRQSQRFQEPQQFQTPPPSERYQPPAPPHQYRQPQRPQQFQQASQHWQYTSPPAYRSNPPSFNLPLD